MDLEVGNVVEGKVVGITKFGAFIRIDEGIEGLVHISELSHDFVDKVDDVVKMGDTVSAKIISKDEKGKIALSIKAVTPKPEPIVEEFAKTDGPANSSFEDMLEKFMKQSNEKIQQARTRENKRGNNRRKNQ